MGSLSLFPLSDTHTLHTMKYCGPIDFYSELLFFLNKRCIRVVILTDIHM